MHSVLGLLATAYLIWVNHLDRAQPSCGWCTRNGQLCEYKERKKPGLRAGYGKELEQRLGMFLPRCGQSHSVSV